MSLKVWLPLNGDLNNQGLSPTTITNSGATVDNNGKIGKCYYFNNTYLWGSLDYSSFNTEFSVAFWYKITTAFSGNKHIVCLANTIGWAKLIFTCAATANNVFSFNIGDNSTSQRALTCPYITGQWQHICFTFNNKVAKVYINGILNNTVNYSLNPSWAGLQKFGVGGAPNGGEICTTLFLNDVRIYNHALSVKEVKEIAKGLILHYKLSKPLPNLLKNGAFTSLTTDNTGLGTGIYATSWGGYNGGISNPTTNYHACIDQNTFGYPVYMYNETNGSRNWKGISQSISKNLIEGSTDYIFSCDVYQTLSGGKIWGGFYYKKTGASSNTFASGQYNITASMIPTNNWTRVSIKVPFNNDIDSSVSSVSFYIYGYGFSDNGIVYIKNVKLEKGVKATAFIPNESDPLYAAAGYASGIVYDCSGYQNNGIEVGTITGSSDTPRYRSSEYFDGIDSAIQVPYNATVFQTNFTINLWFKKTELGLKNYETLFGGPSGFEMDTRNSNSTTLSLYMTGTRGGNAFSSFSFGEWYMVTMVNDGTNELYYINGELKKTIEKKSMPTGNYFIGAWSTSSKQNFKGYISDFRIYCTALSAADVKALYTDAGYVDKNGNFHAYEFVEG